MLSPSRLPPYWNARRSREMLGHEGMPEQIAS
jgi:hypothetical protein